MDNRSVALAILEQIFNAHDLSAVDRLIAPDCDEHGRGIGDKNGAEEVRALAQALWQAFPDGKFEVRSCFGEGDLVCTVATFTGTHQGHFFGVPPSGRKVRIDSVDVVRVVNGKCVEHWGGFESGAVIQQLQIEPSMEMA